MPNNAQNPFKPHLMRITEIRDETPDVRTLRLEFVDDTVAQTFDWHPGQFAEYSVFGEGGCVFTIANSPTRKGYIECSFKLMGKVTTALRRLNEGQIVGFR
ncbi:MAG TPA: heterodisulfide reductase subunit F, partial [Armatimonadetes bacterium]|nr:heterodisulfide reductase subunit F [Armatimonadota bacterium]